MRLEGFRTFRTSSVGFRVLVFFASELFCRVASRVLGFGGLGLGMFLNFTMGFWDIHRAFDD